MVNVLTKMAKVNRPLFIICHSTGGIGNDNKVSTRHLTTYDIDRAHKALWPDFKSNLGWWCGYQYVIEESGKCIQTRSEIEEGAHTRGLNTSSIGICWTGNGDMEKPTQEQESRLADLIRELAERWRIPPERIVPHRRFTQSKTCYGSLLSDEWARWLPANYPVLSVNPIEKKKKELNLLIQVYFAMVDVLRKLQAAQQLRGLGSLSASEREH